MFKTAFPTALRLLKLLKFTPKLCSVYKHVAIPDALPKASFIGGEIPASDAS